MKPETWLPATWARSKLAIERLAEEVQADTRRLKRRRRDLTEQATAAATATALLTGARHTGPPQDTRLASIAEDRGAHTRFATPPGHCDDPIINDASESDKLASMAARGRPPAHHPTAAAYCGGWGDGDEPAAGGGGGARRSPLRAGELGDGGSPPRAAGRASRGSERASAFGRSPLLPAAAAAAGRALAPPGGGGAGGPPRDAATATAAAAQRSAAPQRPGERGVLERGGAERGAAASAAASLAAAAAAAEYIFPLSSAAAAADASAAARPRVRQQLAAPGVGMGYGLRARLEQRGGDSKISDYIGALLTGAREYGAPDTHPMPDHFQRSSMLTRMRRDVPPLEQCLPTHTQILREQRREQRALATKIKPSKLATHPMDLYMFNLAARAYAAHYLTYSDTAISEHAAYIERLSKHWATLPSVTLLVYDQAVREAVHSDALTFAAATETQELCKLSCLKYSATPPTHSRAGTRTAPRRSERAWFRTAATSSCAGSAVS